MSEASSEDLVAVIDRICELRVLEPDAEADACGPAFESWARDRMDEWHAALAAFDGEPIDGLEREVVIVRSAAELCALAEARPAQKRTQSACARIAQRPPPLMGDEVALAAIRTLRSRWEPAFRQSNAWQMAVSLLLPAYPVPWVALACREVLRAARREQLDAPSPFAPWLALMGRGAWPLPIGEGAIALWVPRADEGVAGIDRALRTQPDLFRGEREIELFGLRQPRSYIGPGGTGIEFFGPEQSARLDGAPALVLRPRMADMAPNPPGPSVNLLPIAPPTMNLPFSRPELPPPDAVPAPEPSGDSMLDRVRRWFKK